MSGSGTRFSAFIETHRVEIEALGTRGVMLVGAFPEGGALLDRALSGLNASALGALGIEFLKVAFAEGAFTGLDVPVVVDVQKAATAWEALGSPAGAQEVREALLRGRVRLQGTDGVRGPVALETQGNPVLQFGRTGEITPEFIEVLCYSFARLARRTGKVRKGGRVVVAEDGRDAATGGRFAGAMKAGLQAAGLLVLDLGVAPTPAVPFAQARLAAPLGVVLTASHNPSSQNGVKFFIDGYKMLPEGAAGDYGLSAVACETAWKGTRRKEQGALEDVRHILDEFADFIILNLPSAAADMLADVQIVFDPANGAFTGVGRRVFEKLGLAVEIVNDDPQGHNINQGGGVAEIEGHRRITAEEADGSPMLSSVSLVIDHARTSGRDVYGLVTDGDGDRGFIVAAPGGAGEAVVADGDAVAFVLAREFLESGAICDDERSQWEFVGTVESDLELFGHVERSLGFATRIVCVGDKWLGEGFRKGRRLVVGQEVSGHILWPTYTKGPDGAHSSILSGNGLLTTLSALVAAQRGRLSPVELAEPFEGGTFLTMYTYNVNKALFFKGSRAWREDVQAAAAALDCAVGKGFESWRIQERAEEPDMLYIVLEDAEGAAVGAVFARNSGTENKTGVYARGRKSLEPLLRNICLTLRGIHQRLLKDTESSGWETEMTVLEILKSGPLSPERLGEQVRERLGHGIRAEALDAVLFGMRKEGLIEFAEGRIARV